MNKNRPGQISRAKKRRSEPLFAAPPAAASPWSFLSSLFLLAVLCVGSFFIYKLLSYRDTALENQMATFKQSLEEAQTKHTDYLLDKFPNGYRLFIVSENKIIPSAFNSLPEDLKANWAYARVRKFKQDSLSFKVPGVTYRPARISSLWLDVEISRVPRRTMLIGVQPGFNFIVEILQDFGSYVVCVLSFR